jgi:hypothetical protein
MLEEKVDAGRGIGVGDEGGGEKEVAVGVAEIVVEERSRDQLELVPLE